MRWRDRLRRPRPHVLGIAVERGTGVLLHGIASSAATFEHVLPVLAPHHRVIALDLLGFGSSRAPHDAGFTMDEHAAALEATLRVLGIDRFVLVGHSLGLWWQRATQRRVPPGSSGSCS